MAERKGGKKEGKEGKHTSRCLPSLTLITTVVIDDVCCVFKPNTIVRPCRISQHPPTAPWVVLLSSPFYT